MRRWIMTAWGLMASALVLAGDAGAPPMEVYLPDQYGAHSQNWHILAGDDGLIHVGNGVGVLQFDGARWQLIATPHRTRVRRVLADGEHHLLAATTDELLRVDLANGSMSSLSASWPPELRAWGEAMGLARTSGGIYLQSSQRVVRIGATGALQDWTSDAGFQQSFAIGENYYVQDRAQGLRWVDPSEPATTELDAAPSGVQLAGDQLSFMLTESDGGILLSARKQGLLRYRDGKLQPWRTALDTWMQEQIVLPGVALPDGSVVVGTLRAGLARIDARGDWLQQLDARDGLPSDSVYALQLDRQGNLWVGFDGGIARLRLDSPVSIYDRRHQISTVWGIHRHQGRLLLATRMGVQIGVDAAPGRGLSFERLAAKPTQAWEFLSVGEELWIAGSDGIWRVRDTRPPPQQWTVEPLFATRFAYSLVLGAQDAEKVFAATDQGVVRLRRSPDGVIEPALLDGYRGEARQFARQDDGTFWAGTPNGRLLRWHTDATRIEVLDSAHGVPAGMTWPATRAEGVRFGTTEGLMRWASDSQRLEAAPEPDAASCAITRLRAVGTTLWTACGGELQRSTSKPAQDEPWHVFPGESIYAIHSDPDGVLWVGRERSLLRIEPRNDPTPTESIAPRIRAVLQQTSEGLVALPWDAATPPLWPVATTRLRVLFAWPDFARASRVKFSTRLDGLDADWIPAGAEAQRDFTHLRGGRYRFRVRAEGPGAKPTETSFAFAIALPWYRHPWAWLLWCALAVASSLALGAMAARWRTRALAASNRRLQGMVDERTVQLRHQAEQLQQLDVAKSRFFAAIAHDFRTPLTLILEPVRELLRGLWGALPSSASIQLDRVARNAEHMERLIDRVLDLRTLDAGQLQLTLAPLDLGALVREVAANFAGLAEQRQLRLDLAVPDVGPFVHANAQALETILFNLLGNAFKHAPDAGSVRLTLIVDGSGTAQLSVHDNGPGFALEEIDRVFDHYFRGRDALTQRRPGSGLGLALCRELIERLQGKIIVENAPQGGARVIVSLPTVAPLHSAEPATLASPRTRMAEQSIPRAQTDETEDATTLLVVDDNAELRAFLAERLRVRYRVLEAEDGEAALQLARSALPDLIVSDVSMPRRDGLSLTRALKADRETDMIPIILLASKGALQQRIDGFEMGADDFLVKPFHTSELAARVAALIGARRQLRARLGERTPRADAPTTMPAVPAFVQKLNDTISDHLSDSRFGVSELADALHMDRSTLFKRLKQLDLGAPVHLIRDARLDAAAAMLRRGDGQVTEVAYACGFESLSYFSRSFKERFAQTPRSLL